MARERGCWKKSPRFTPTGSPRRFLSSRRATRCLPAARSLIPYQRMQVLGTKGRIEIEIPFNAADRPALPHFRG